MAERKGPVSNCLSPPRKTCPRSGQFHSGSNFSPAPDDDPMPIDKVPI
jgi:hypothetical protein